jgi:hypothetical protein
VDSLKALDPNPPIREADMDLPPDLTSLPQGMLVWSFDARP